MSLLFGIDCSEPAESKFGAKQELVYHRDCRIRQDSIQVIAEYIEVFTIRKRQRAKPGFLSPAVYAQKFYAGQLAV